jgi:serine protease Do
MLRRIFPAATLAFLLLAGCANPYAQFYTDQLGGRSIEEFPIIDPHKGEPQLYSTNDHERDGRALLENGFVLIGYSSFNAGPVDSKNAVGHAKKVGATIVLVQSQYTNTVTGAIPYTVQNPSQTATTYHSGSVYGSGGYGSYSGTSTTTVPGGYTTHQIPYSVNRYDYAATFWAKSKPLSLGVHTNDLTDEMRRAIGSNRGVVVNVVVKGSPAFNADIMRGDIITMINDEMITDAQSFGAIVSRYAGQDVVLHTYREGRKREVVLRLNPSAY